MGDNIDSQDQAFIILSLTPTIFNPHFAKKKLS